MSAVLSKLLVAATIACAVLFNSAIFAQTQNLGHADARDVIRQIASAIASGNLESVRPSLAPELYFKLLGNEDELQGVMLELGAVNKVEVRARSQVEQTSYYDLQIEHAPPTGEPGQKLVAAGGLSRWTLGFQSGPDVIRTLSFSDSVRDDKVYGDANGDPARQAALSALRAPDDPAPFQIFYATTRKQDRRTFSEERSDAVNLGRAYLHIPNEHKIGQIELAASRRYRYPYQEKLDRSKYFNINDIEPLSGDKWSEAVKNAGSGEALIFIHGFNTTFDEALYRASQVLWDLQYKGAPILFSWASWGGAVEPVGLARSYRYDLDSALLAVEPFLSLIHTLVDRIGIKHVHVVAHSMGNFMMLTALKQEAQKAAPAKLGEIILAAPDIDRSLFLRYAPDVRTIVAGMTLYASSADKALILSKEVARDMPRAGDVPANGPIVMPGVDTIDVTNVGDEFLATNHDVFAVNRSVIDDIGGALEGRRPPRLRQIWPVLRNPPPPQYWKFMP